MRFREPFVYILTNKVRGTFYIGVTSDLVGRIFEHKNGIYKGFTSKNGIDKLVWYEKCETMESAIQREKSLKRWKRVWKIALIEKFNPDWQDLYETLFM